MRQTDTCKPTALVVEDDPFQRELLSELLKDENMDVIECETAEAAKAVLGRTGSKLQVLVTDNTLAGPMTGVELAMCARDKFPRLNIVVVSGDDLKLPADFSFIRKPLLQVEFLRRALRGQP